jgi:hypothetical protein
VRRLRIATALIVSLLTLLCLLPAAAEDAGGWSVLLDEQANLQLSDVRSERYRNQFSPLPLDDLDAALPDRPCGCTTAWHPASRAVAAGLRPDLSRLDLYALEGDKLLRQLHHGRQGEPAPCRPMAATMMLPLPRSSQALDLPAPGARNTSCARPSA